jgi:hypothetical protein
MMIEKFGTYFLIVSLFLPTFVGCSRAPEKGTNVVINSADLASLQKQLHDLTTQIEMFVQDEAVARRERLASQARMADILRTVTDRLQALDQRVTALEEHNT